MSKQKYPQTTSTATSSESTGKRGNKTNGYSSSFITAKRNWMRQHAEERQADYKSMTIQDRLTQAKGRRGESKREVARLEALLSTQPTTEPVKKTAKKKAV